MSLTSYLNDSNHPDLKTKFRTEFPFPGLNQKAELLAKPLTNNYGIVGTAFDYLFRFYIEAHQSKKNVIQGEWVASGAFEALKFRWKKDAEKVNRLANRFWGIKKDTKHF